jgi:hypothetical protein
VGGRGVDLNFCRIFRFVSGWLVGGCGCSVRLGSVGVDGWTGGRVDGVVSLFGT